MSKKKSKKPLRRHIFCCFHGLGGSAVDYRCIGNSLKKLFYVYLDKGGEDNKETLVLFVPKCFEEKKSQRSIEVNGKLAAEEFVKFFKEEILTEEKKDEKFYFSVIGHSLGGLISRNFLKWIFYENKEGVEIRKKHLMPCLYFGLNTPHLGTRNPGSGKHLKILYKSFVKYGKRFFTENFVGQCGKELNLKDKKKDVSECILYKMTDPEQNYYKALKQFDFRLLLSSTRNDHLVPYCSAQIRSHNPHPLPKHKKGEASCRVRSYSGFGDKEKYLLKILNSLGMQSLNEEKESHMCKGTRFNKHEGKTQKCGWQRDNIRRLKFNKDMLNNLQSLDFARLAIEYGVPKSVENMNFHTFILGSWMVGDKNVMYPAASVGVKIVIRVALMIHKDFDRKMKKKALQDKK